MNLELPKLVFEKFSNIKFHENSSNGSRVVTRGRTDRQTGMTKLKVAFRNLANTPKEILKKQKESAWSGLLPLRTEDSVGLL
jgi:hypothetical protein